MELIYLYIKKFKNLEGCEFNLNPRFKSKLNDDKSNIDVVEEEYPLGDNFFGKNVINVSAVLGKNGSGKTNFIEALIIATGGATSYSNIEFALVYLNESGYGSVSSNISISVKFVKRPKQKSLYEFYKNDLKFPTIYYSPIFDGNTITINRNKKFQDVSTNKIVSNLEESRFYQANELIMLLNFLSTDFELIDDGFNYPNKVEIYPRKTDFTLNELPLNEKFNALSKKLEKNIEDPEITSETKISSLTLSLIWTYLDFDVAIHGVEVENIINNYLDSNDFNFLLRLIKLIIEDENLNIEEQELTELLNYIIESQNITNLKKDFYDIEKIKKIIQTLNKLKLKYSPYGYRWYYNETPARISTGEQLYLSLFARLLEALNTLKAYELIVVILDEPDVGLHPEWQKKLLKYVLDFFTSDMCKNKIQLIITSHSPFIASDLPNNNVFYLGAKDSYNPRTFAANIHDLLADSFFMEDGLVGEFAKKKVMEVVNHLRSNKKEYDFNQDYVYSIIDMIGEPTVRGKLLDEYFKVYGIQGDDRIALLEKEIENIKSQRND